MGFDVCNILQSSPTQPTYMPFMASYSESSENYIYISSESPHYVIKSPTEIDSTLPIVTIYGEL